MRDERGVPTPRRHDAEGAPDPGRPRRRGPAAALARALRVVRQVVGAPDYERYLEHHARAHAGTSPLPRREFYAEFVSWRFGSGPTRCC